MSKPTEASSPRTFQDLQDAADHHPVPRSPASMQFELRSVVARYNVGIIRGGLSPQDARFEQNFLINEIEHIEKEIKPPTRSSLALAIPTAASLTLAGVIFNTLAGAIFDALAVATSDALAGAISPARAPTLSDVLSIQPRPQVWNPQASVSQQCHPVSSLLRQETLCHADQSWPTGGIPNDSYFQKPGSAGPLGSRWVSQRTMGIIGLSSIVMFVLQLRAEIKYRATARIQISLRSIKGLVGDGQTVPDEILGVMLGWRWNLVNWM